MATGLLRCTKYTVANVLLTCQKAYINREDPDQTASEEDNVWRDPSSASLLCAGSSELLLFTCEKNQISIKSDISQRL